MKQYLCQTFYIDKDHPSITRFVADHIQDEQSDLEKAVAIYYAVRDKIQYNPYSFGRTPEDMKASTILKKRVGYCVGKAVVLCACARAAGIPARLGFADVKNHLTTPKLKAAMGTDIFVYHGYTDLFLEGKWVKATPAFNIELCEKFKVKPLEFDGKEDSIFHAFDQAGNKHMEYVKDRGTSADLPLEEIFAESAKYYPKMMEHAEAISAKDVF